MSRLDRELARMLQLSAGATGVELIPNLLRSRDWSSALFSGERLTFELAAADGEPFETWLADLPDAEFPLRGWFVADADLTERRAGAAVVDFLVIEEA